MNFFQKMEKYFCADSEKAGKKEEDGAFVRMGAKKDGATKQEAPSHKKTHFLPNKPPSLPTRELTLILALTASTICLT